MSIWRFRAELALYKVRTKQRKRGDGELVDRSLIWRCNTPSRSVGKIAKLSTCQLIRTQPKLLQFRQFDDFGRNWSYTKSRQNSEKRGMVNWFTMVLFDVEIRLQDNWVQLWIYRPVSLLPLKWSTTNFVNLTISGGIGPIQSQDKIAKKEGWWSGWPQFYMPLWYALRSLGKVVHFPTYQHIRIQQKLL